MASCLQKKLLYTLLMVATNGCSVRSLLKKTRIYSTSIDATSVDRGCRILWVARNTISTRILYGIVEATQKQK